METSKELYDIISKEKDSCVIVDVGACNLLTDNMKYFSRDEDYKILLIEPDPRQQNLILSQLANNSFAAKIYLTDIAVSDSYGVMDFIVSETVGHSRFDNDNFRKAKPNSKDQYTTRVLTNPLAAILDEFYIIDIDFLKIDVEGMDEMVIKQGLEFSPKYIMAEHQYNEERIKKQTELLKDYAKVCSFDDSILWRLR